MTGECESRTSVRLSPFIRACRSLKLSVYCDVRIIGQRFAVLSSLMLLVFPLFISPDILHAQSSAERRNRELDFSRRVSESRLRKSVIQLVRFGNRLGGTPSGDRASDFVAQAFRVLGFQSESVKDPLKPAFVHDGWKLRVDQPRRLRGLIQNDWLGGFSPSARERTARLTFVDVQEGWNAKDVSHAVVLLQGTIADDRYAQLASDGALAILEYEVVNSAAYSNWAMITNLPPSDRNPIPLFDISNLAGRRLRQELQKGTSVVIRFASKSHVRPGSPRTVVATMRGATDSCYIICAHGDSDSGGPGADDNASGVAGVMEIARVLHTMRSSSLPQPKRTIRFIVWGSEYFSTEDYVRKHQAELGKILGVLNFDEIGTGKSRNCIYFEGNDIPQNEALLRILNSIGEEYVGKPGFWKEATTNPSQGGTDSYVFLPDYLSRLHVPSETIPSVTIYTAAWNAPKKLAQTPGWASRAWHGQKDTVVVDYSLFYHSSLDLPQFTTEKEPFDMTWGVRAVGIALLRLAW